MNDVAFVIVDLEERKRPDPAARFLTAYLEATGDYDGLGVLRFYVVYRAMARAKVARFRCTSQGPTHRTWSSTRSLRRLGWTRGQGRCWSLTMRRE